MIMCSTPQASTGYHKLQWVRRFPRLVGSVKLSNLLLTQSSWLYVLAMGSTAWGQDVELYQYLVIKKGEDNSWLLSNWGSFANFNS